MTDVWDANTFPVRKYNSRTFHLKVRRSRLFRFFRRFPQINVGGDSARIPFVEHASRESRVALPPKGRLRQLATPLGTVFRELGHLILCNVLSWLSPLLVSLYLSYVLVYINSLLLLVRFKMYAWSKYLFNWCTQTPTLFAHTVSEKGPYTRVHGSIRSGGESVIMLGLRLAWLQWTLI